MVRAMERFEHGGDIYAHPDAVDFSANINPLGMPAAACEAIVEHVRDFEAYPDVACRELRGALALAEGTSPERIVCTAGASDLFQRLCAVLRPKTALVTAPCFSGYEEALEQAGARIVRHHLREEDGFDVTEAILGFSQGELVEMDSPANPPAATQPVGTPANPPAATQPVGTPASPPAATPPVGPGAKPDMLFLCTPNNPTGLVLRRELLVRVLEEAREANVTVVLDECFADFTGEPSAVELCPDYPNLVVARAFTKTYAMAGLRVGYGISSDEGLVARLARAGQPWAVSGPAQVAAAAALGEDGWVQRARAYVAVGREVLTAGLEECGMRVIPGRANYLMFQSPRELYEPLLARGFIIRRCGNFQGLDESWYRIAVRTAAENAAFLRALRGVCS